VTRRQTKSTRRKRSPSRMMRTRFFDEIFVCNPRFSDEMDICTEAPLVPRHQAPRRQASRRRQARMLCLSPVDVLPVDVSTVDFSPVDFSNTDALSSAALRRLQARLAAPRSTYRQTGPTDRPDLPTYQASERRRSVACASRALCADRPTYPTYRPTGPTDRPDLPTDRTSERRRCALWRVSAWTDRQTRPTDRPDLPTYRASEPPSIGQDVLPVLPDRPKDDDEKCFLKLYHLCYTVEGRRRAGLRLGQVGR
jgi:hypothetical protein